MVCGTIVTLAAPLDARAQVVPWQVFLDSLSTAACDVVNADNAELVVLSAGGQLVIVTGTDVLLADTFVDDQGFVFFEGDPVGTIDFATDGDGRRTLWWVSLTGTVVNVNGFTGEPRQTNQVPSDFLEVPCDACEFWDDPSVCAEPEPPITVNLCGVQVPIVAGAVLFGLAFMRFTPRRRMGSTA